MVQRRDEYFTDEMKERIRQAVEAREIGEEPACSEQWNKLVDTFNVYSRIKVSREEMEAVDKLTGGMITRHYPNMINNLHDVSNVAVGMIFDDIHELCSCIEEQRELRRAIKP